MNGPRLHVRSGREIRVEAARIARDLARDFHEQGDQELARVINELGERIASIKLLNP